MEAPSVVRQAFGEGSMRQVKSKVKSMLIIFFHIKGIVREVLIQAGQTVNSAHYCVVLRRLHENVRRLRHELW
jgi:hypothetical protein